MPEDIGELARRIEYLFKTHCCDGTCEGDATREEFALWKKNLLDLINASEIACQEIHLTRGFIGRSKTLKRIREKLEGVMQEVGDALDLVGIPPPSNYSPGDGPGREIREWMERKSWTSYRPKDQMRGIGVVPSDIPDPIPDSLDLLE